MASEPVAQGIASGRLQGTLIFIKGAHILHQRSQIHAGFNPTIRTGSAENLIGLEIKTQTMQQMIQI